MSVFVLFAAVFSGAPAFASLILGAKHIDSDCDKPVPVWNLVQAVLLFSNIGIAIYCFTRFSRPYDRRNPDDKNFFARMRYLLCEDVLMAIYILILLFAVAWNIVGHAWLGASNGDECPQSLRTATLWALILQWFYLLLGFMTFLLVSVSDICGRFICPAFAGTPCGFVARMVCPCCMPDPDDADDRRGAGRPSVAHPGGFSVPHPVGPGDPSVAAAKSQSNTPSADPYAHDPPPSAAKSPPAPAPAPQRGIPVGELLRAARWKKQGDVEQG